MAVNIRQIFPLQQAKVRRLELGRYLHLDGGRHLIAAALLLSLLSLISLGQTGRLASQGHEITSLAQQKVVLLRERNELLLRLSRAQSLDSVERRTRDLKLRPLTSEQIRYVTVERSTTAESQHP